MSESKQTNDEQLTVDKFAEDFLSLLAEHRLIDDYVIRDYKIRRQYALLTEVQQMAKTQAQEVLAENFFISVKHIQRIIYEPNYNRKKRPFAELDKAV